MNRPNPAGPLSAALSTAQRAYTEETGRPWPEFFVETIRFQSEWLAVFRPELTRAYLLALADLCASSTPARYQQAIADADAAAKTLLDSITPNMRLPETPAA